MKNPIFIFLALIAGASAGIVATVVLNSSLDNYAASLFHGQTPDEPTITHQLAVSDDAARQAVATVAGQSLVSATKPTLDTHLPGSLIGESASLGYGVVVSTDGWLLFRREAIGQQTSSKPVLPNLEFWIAGTRYTPTQIITDNLTDAVLLKVDASNLSPVAFADDQNLNTGATVWGTAGRSLWPAVITDLNHASGFVLPAEQFASNWQLAAAPSSSFPLFDSRGGLLALTGASSTLPLSEVSVFVKSSIRSGSPSHAGLGAYVLDLESALNLDPSLRQGQLHGALIMAPTTSSAAIVKSSPASTAGLVAGDIITQIDGSQVDHQHQLANLLALYAPGETVSVTYLHSGNSKTITVTLVDAATLLY